MKLNAINITSQVFLALVMVLASSTVNARSTELVDPPMVTTQCELSSEEMISAIISGGAIRGWRPVDNAPGNIQLQYNKDSGKHIITVNVAYTSNSFVITYKDSVNLNYKVKRNGKRMIHPRPVGWMSNLSGDIESITFEKCATS